MLSFTAIDFETADHQRDSACALAMVRVERGRVVDRQDALIRPPRKDVLSTRIHGLTWDDLRDADDFATVWARMRRMVDGVDVLAAHSASFDRSVLAACCAAAGIAPPTHRWLCTVKLAKHTWRRAGNTLPDVCAALGIDLVHHDAASDALACARVALAAHDHGAILDRHTDGGIARRPPPTPRAEPLPLRAGAAKIAAGFTWLFAPRA